MAALIQVAHDVRLIDGGDRTQTHGNGGELPIVRHQPGVRIRGEAFAVHFAAEVVQLIFGQAAFHIGARIHARRAVTLEVDQVARLAIFTATPEMVETHFVQSGG